MFALSAGAIKITHRKDEPLNGSIQSGRLPEGAEELIKIVTKSI